MKKKTFVDSGVLLTAFRGLEPDSEDAQKICEDPDREFASSIFVQMELLPKPVFFGNDEETEFYETFLQTVLHWVDFSDELLQAALEEAKACGMAAMDAIHVAAARSAGCDELVTTEKSSRPMHRSSLVQVVCIHNQRNVLEWYVSDSVKKHGRDDGVRVPGGAHDSWDEEDLNTDSTASAHTMRTNFNRSRGYGTRSPYLRPRHSPAPHRQAREFHGAWPGIGYESHPVSAPRPSP